MADPGRYIGTVKRTINPAGQQAVLDGQPTGHDGQPAGHAGGRGSLLSVVVPVYNEAEVLGECHRRLVSVLDNLDMAFEIVYVNDGSTDSTPAVLEGLRGGDGRHSGHAGRVTLVDLSRNFGKEVAMTAGLDFARGDAVIIIDADMQDPPELIPDMVKEWRLGYDVVNMRRSNRRSESFMKRATARAFYWVMRRISKDPIPENVGDFRLLSRRAVDSLRVMPERNRFMKGLFAWIGYPQKEIAYAREARAAGKTKWNYRRLWGFALDGITSFSIVPLKVATYIGLLTAGGAFLYGVWIIVKTLVFVEPVAGFPTLMVTILFLGGVQLIAIGILGEYLGRMFIETKQRPLYFLKRYDPAGTPAAPANTPSSTGEVR
ncbi:MAG: glycosyltransferase family 2 protein [Deltaproteobacteria bacterium]|nr:glycosyltransferase family 2 protein [Deltaproteobacteria bacterium]